MVRDTPREVVWMNGHSPCIYTDVSGGPSGDTGGRIKAARKELAILPHKDDGPGQVSSLGSTVQRTNRMSHLPEIMA